MAIAALLFLKYESPLPLERSSAVQKPVGHRIPAPCVHMRTPWGKSGEMCKSPQSDCNQQYGQNRNWPAPPALFSFARKKWQEEQSNNRHHRTNQQSWSFHGRRKQREQGVQPQKKVIRFRGRLNN